MASMKMSVDVDFLAGTTIDEAFSEALEFSRRNNCFVDFNFNGIPMSICALSGIFHKEADIETYKKMYFSMLKERERKEQKQEVKTINVAKDFSDTPMGVFREDSNSSAERFREDILIPALKCGHVKVDLSGTSCGYSAAWLQGVFVTLYACNQFDEEYLDSHLEVYASDRNDNCYVDAVKRYIEEAKSVNALKNERNSKLDEQVTKLVKAMDLVDEAYKWFLDTNWDKLAIEDCMAIQRKIGQLISDINDIQKLKEGEQA